MAVVKRYHSQYSSNHVTAHCTYQVGGSTSLEMVRKN